MTMDPGYELYDLAAADLDEQAAAQAAGIPVPPDPVTSPAALAFEQARADYDTAYEALIAASQRLTNAHRHYLTTIRSTPLSDIRSTPLSDEQTEALIAAFEHLDATLLVVARIIRETEELEVGAHGIPGLSPAARRALLTAVSESLARAADSQ